MLLRSENLFRLFPVEHALDSWFSNWLGAAASQSRDATSEAKPNESMLAFILTKFDGHISLK